MMHTLKAILAQLCEKWVQAAKKNKGKTIIDISAEFREIYARNIVTITLGEDINDELVEINVLGNDQSFSLQKVTLSVAIQECGRQIVSCFPTKILNPLYMLGLINLEPNLTPYCRRVANNCKLLRNHVMNYVRDR